MKSAQYPIVGLRTERHKHKKKLENLSGELTGSNELDANTLIEFLETFIDHHEIDMPQYTDETGGYKFSQPSSYDEKFVPYWDKTKKALSSADENRSQGEEDKAGTSTPSGAKVDSAAAFAEALRELSKLYTPKKKP